MSLFDIYKAKQLGINTDSLFATLLGKRLGTPYVTITESKPYVKRQTADGLNVASKCIDTIVGGTIVWNQLCKHADFTSDTTRTKNGITCVYSEPNTFTLKAGNKATSGGGFYLTSESEMAIPAGHKILISGLPRQFNPNTEIALVVSNGGYSNQAYEKSQILSAMKGDTEVLQIYIFFRANFEVTEDIVIKPRVHDLTQMFGATVADYMYSLEQSTHGAGTDLFFKMFPEDDYTYSYSLESVNVSAHINRDANNNIIGNYELDESLVLRGILKLDAANNLYYDGDVYESDGKVTRYYGIRAYQSGDATDGSTMVTDGVNTVYKLGTPTIEAADPFTNPQMISKDGTEEYVDYAALQGTRDVSVPVGHNTQYNMLEG